MLGGHEAMPVLALLRRGGWMAWALGAQVNAIQMKETVEENASTTERVFQDRQYQVGLTRETLAPDFKNLKLATLKLSRLHAYGMKSTRHRGRSVPGQAVVGSSETPKPSLTPTAQTQTHQPMT